MNSGINGHLLTFPCVSATLSAWLRSFDEMALHITFILRRPLIDLFIVPCLLSATWGAEIVLSTTCQVVTPQVRYFSFPTSLGYGYLSSAFLFVIPFLTAIYGTLLYWYGHIHDSRILVCFSTMVDLTRLGFVIFLDSRGSLA